MRNQSNEALCRRLVDLHQISQARRDQITQLEADQERDNREWDAIEEILLPRVLAAPGPVHVVGYRYNDAPFNHLIVADHFAEALEVYPAVRPADLTDPAPEPVAEPDTAPDHAAADPCLVDVGHLMHSLIAADEGDC